MPWLYRPTNGLWLIWKERPRIAIDWGNGLRVRLNLLTAVRRRG